VSGDETARASLIRLVSLELADGFALGWKAAVMMELDWMRAKMPYADTLVLRLECERRADDSER
jgi:hypothetical protein